MAVGAAVASLTTPAIAGAEWKPLAPLDAWRNHTQPGITRDAGGALHVLWQRSFGPTQESLLHTAVAPDGKIGAPTTIVSGWSTVQTPDVVAVPAGLLAVFQGFQGGGVETTISTATSADGGATWSVDNSKLVNQVADEPSLTVGPDGTPFVAFGHVSLVRSFARGTTAHDYQAGLGSNGPGSGYRPDLDRSSAGRVWLSWYSQATSHPGVFVQQVDTATGAPLGQARKMPGSTTTVDGKEEGIMPLGRAAIASRSDFGDMFTVAAGGYPVADRALVWRVGNPKSLVLNSRDDKGKGIRAITVTGAPDGRMWVVWSTGSHDDMRIHARRSNAAATRWSAETIVKPPAGAGDVITLDASVAPQGSLDVLGRFIFASGNGASAPQLTRLLPSLTLTGKPRKVDDDETTTVRFRVTEAFAPVRGATVSIGDDRARTNADGTVSIKVTAGAKKRKLRAVATAPGFAPARLALRVR